MFKCNRCGDTKEELPTFEEKHPYGDAYTREYFEDYDCGCGGEFEKAIQCDNCKEWFLEDELLGYKNPICLNCACDFVDEKKTIEFFQENLDIFEEYIEKVRKHNATNKRELL